MNREANPKPTHHPDVRRGEEIRAEDGKEPGRHDREQTGAGRPSGGSTSRDATAINPESTKAVDPKSPQTTVRG
jgi:hypothetical protein